MVGIESSDDAGVFRLNKDTALIQTLDFFTPTVDDARDFGRIAAANALSDIYAMGGIPLTAMNIVCFPSDDLPESILQETLAGGWDVDGDGYVQGIVQRDPMTGSDIYQIGRAHV